MQTVILAGGLGTRLRKAVNGIPKSMAPVAGRPFLEHQLLHLKDKGFSEIVLLIGYLSEAIVDHFGDGSSLGLKIAYSKEGEPLGTAGALKNAESLLDNSFLLLNGDTFLDVDYNDLIRLHFERAALVTVAVVEAGDSSRYGSIVLGEEGRIEAFSEKKETGPGLINGGIYVVSKNVLAYISPRERTSLESEVIPRLVDEGKPVYGVIVKGYFVDIGTPESYRSADAHFRSASGRVDWRRGLNGDAPL